jgi:hypothetical protein
MSDVRTTLLFTIKLGAAPPQMLGKTPLGDCLAWIRARQWACGWCALRTERPAAPRETGS